MVYKHTYKVMWILCAMMATIHTSPVSETKGTADSSSSHFYGESGEIVKHRERRQLNNLAWNNGFFQNLGKAFSETVDRLRGAVRSSTVSDSPLLRMVNDFRDRLGPVILRTFYTTALQNVWDQIRSQARSSVNEFFDRIGGSR